MNEGQRPKYRVENSHEAIIPAEQFAMAQLEQKRRAEQCKHTGQKKNTYPFSGMVVCGICGGHFRRKKNHGKPIWVCRTYNSVGKGACSSKAVPEDVLAELAADVSNSGEFETIRAEADNTLVFILSDGTEIVRSWQDHSRADSWTDEMKEKARQKTLQRRSLQNGH